MDARPINPSDLISIRGAYRHRICLPAVPGYEGVGTVVETGPLASSTLIGCILQLKNAEFGGQFMQNTANINTKEFRKTSCWIEHGAVGSFLR
uniref:alcohol dehydrogenase catalytic domain-containing protein n=1 Tax=Brevibacillus sp. FSL K6-2834 TaxID=2954680 RepID=UPI00406C4F2C